MSEDGDYTPATHWKGHNFDQARQNYDVNAGRGYAKAQLAGPASKLLPDSISTDSDSQCCIDSDGSGSMDGWDKQFFVKAPYFEHEVKKEYLGEDAKISFGGFCDLEDDYPVQMRPFADGPEMLKELDKIQHVGGGGGSALYHEAHGLAMLYRIHNTHMPKAKNKPVYIIITDEMPCARITVVDAKKHARVVIEKTHTIEEIVEQTMEKYSLYIILKPYGSERISGDTLPAVTQQVYDRWKTLVGAERIALLSDANRAVDVIFGLLAQEVGKVGYFRKEIEGRQNATQVATVYRSLKTVHALAKPDTVSGTKKRSGNSATKGLGAGKPTDEW